MAPIKRHTLIALQELEGVVLAHCLGGDCLQLRKAQARGSDV
jgi:hypothetical protein